MHDVAAPASRRSNFVTVVAWVFICLAGAGTVISLLQNVMVAFLFPMKEMQQAMHDTHGAPVPPLFQFMFLHFQLFVGAMFVLTATLFAASIGLLRRKNWARILFIVFMALGIAWNLLGLVFQFAFFSAIPPVKMPPNAPPDFAAGFNTMMTVMMVVSAAIAIAFSVLFGWIIKRLVSDEVRAEFGVADDD